MSNNINKIQDQRFKYPSKDFVKLSAERRNGDIRGAYQQLINNVKNRGENKGEINHEQNRDV